MWPLATAVVFVVAIYGGYFGAGIGILMITALSLLRMGDVHRVVPLKNLLTGCLRGVAVLVLVIDGVIDWGYGADGPGRPHRWLPGRHADRQGKPDRSTRGRRSYRIRAGSVLLLDPLRSTRATLWRRVSQISRPTVEVRGRATLTLLALRTCLGAQPERGA